jgi:hypothetical protein
MTHFIDPEHAAAVSAAAEAQLAALDSAAGRLAKVPVEAHSRDRRIRVRATAGHVNGLILSEDALTRYTPGALGEVVTRTVREAQRRAEEAYQAGLGEIDLSAVTEANRIVAEWIANGHK